jgi:tetratricopeptide (TPR) repeat protein
MLGLSTSARDHYEQALACEKRADHAGALTSLNEAIRLDPQNADAHYVRGLIFEFNGDYDGAVEELETVRRLQPRTIDALVIERVAPSNLLRIIRVGPRMEYLLRMRFGEEGSPDAKIRAREAIAGDLARIRRRRGTAHYTGGNFDEAIGDFSETIRLEPSDTRAYFLRGRAYCARGRFKEAIADFNESVAVDPPAAQVMLGNCYKEIGDYDKAITALSAAIRLDRSNADAYFARAATYHLKGEAGKAVSDYTETLRLDPKRVQAHEGRGDAYRKLGDNERARADEESARRLLQERDQPGALGMPPSAIRVAARALVLAAVIYRAEMESDPTGEEWRKKLIRWVHALGLDSELERSERDLLHTPIGGADEDAVANGYWRASGLGVLAWALHRFELPPYDQLIDLPQAAASLGFSEQLLAAMDMGRARELLQVAGLRPREEIQRFASHITIASWRLRQFQIDPDRAVRSMDFDVRSGRPVAVEGSSALRKNEGPGIGERMDFAAYLRRHPRFKEHWLDGLRLIDDDLAIGDKTLADASVEEVQQCTSNAIECQIAAYWLQGDDPTYSNVSPSTLLSAC